MFSGFSWFLCLCLVFWIINLQFCINVLIFSKSNGSWVWVAFTREIKECWFQFRQFWGNGFSWRRTCKELIRNYHEKQSKMKQWVLAFLLYFFPTECEALTLCMINKMDYMGALSLTGSLALGTFFLIRAEKDPSVSMWVRSHPWDLRNPLY